MQATTFQLTLESLADALASNIEQVPLLEHLCNIQLLTDLVALNIFDLHKQMRHDTFATVAPTELSKGAWGSDLEFPEVSHCWKASLFQVANLWLWNFALQDLLVAHLDGTVPILFHGSQLSDLVAAVKCYDCATGGEARWCEDLGHACFGSEYSDTCLYAACNCTETASASALLRAIVASLHVGDSLAGHKLAASARRHLCAGCYPAVHTGLHSAPLPLSLELSKQRSCSRSWDPAV